VPTLELNSEEKAMFEKSAAAVKELVDAMAKLGV
jgi:malate/lactate dehydrogenase